MRKQILLIVCLIMANHAFSQENAKEVSFDKTFAHSVYIWLKNPESEADRAKFEASLFKFLNSSEYTKTNYVGMPPKATRAVVDDSFTYNMIVTFESAAAQELYQKEQVHLTFIEECQDLWKKVLVYDSQGIAQ
ncbi:MAG: Dabb family protein [Croceitalea sp.]|nr:Dabb family protein [Croceitalea sp.]MBT8237850.1 Dabb family protein [Croceitalea sp.]NNC33638.1 Dabb family protein [Croceitalea sp.]NNL08438.1 Dabb family protein [Croceitalea sp.]NNM17587.1 Dabb family protein [Croceitalea sp.]